MTCGVDGRIESSGIGVEALVEDELELEAGCEREVALSAAVLMVEPTVMREDVAEAVAGAEVQALLRSAVGQEGLGVRGADVEAFALSSTGSPLDGTSGGTIIPARSLDQ